MFTMKLYDDWRDGIKSTGGRTNIDKVTAHVSFAPQGRIKAIEKLIGRSELKEVGDNFHIYQLKEEDRQWLS